MTRVLNMLNTLLPPSTCGQSISPTSCRPLKCDLNHRSTSLNVSPEITIAVVGPSGVGKSNFMQHALDLEKPPTTPVVFKKVSLDGSIFRVRLLEIDVESISFDDHSNEIIWPDVIEGHSIKDQPIDGVLNLFDSTDLTTITKHPRLHSKFLSTLGIPWQQFANNIVEVVMENQNPSITIACKCDSECLADEETFVSARRILGSVKVHQTASDEPTSQKRCISTIVGAVVRRSQFTGKFFPAPLRFSFFFVLLFFPGQRAACRESLFMQEGPSAAPVVWISRCMSTGHLTAISTILPLSNVAHIPVCRPRWNHLRLTKISLCLVPFPLNCVLGFLFKYWEDLIANLTQLIVVTRAPTPRQTDLAPPCCLDVASYPCIPQ